MENVIEQLVAFLQGNGTVAKPPVIPPPVVARQGGEKPLYHAVSLLTPTERLFYQELVAILPQKYAVLTKVRVADLVQPSAEYHSKEWFAAFGRIKAKHIDFVIVQKSDCEVVRLIELDDASHMRRSRRERDRFVNEVFEGAGLKMIRVRVDRRADFLMSLQRPS